MQRRTFLFATAALPLALSFSPAFAFEGAELYEGERALLAEAEKEGMVVSFDTARNGPTGNRSSRLSRSVTPASK